MKWFFASFLVVLILTSASYAQVSICSCPGNHNWPTCKISKAEDCGSPQCRFFSNTGQYGGSCVAPEVFTCKNPYGFDVRYRGHNKFELIDEQDRVVWQSPSFETGSYTRARLTFSDGLGVAWHNDSMWLRCKDDIKFSKNIISIRHGRSLDLHYLVGVKGTNEFIVHSARLQDGEHHGVVLDSNAATITIGREKDVIIKYCFDGNTWRSSHVSRPQANLAVILNGGQIQWKPDYNDCTHAPISFFDGSTLKR